VLVQTVDKNTCVNKCVDVNCYCIKGVVMRYVYFYAYRYFGFCQTVVNHVAIDFDGNLTYS